MTKISNKSSLRRKIPKSYTISEKSLKQVYDVTRADTKETLKILNAVAHPIRLRILRALEVKELCVCVFVAALNCKYSKLSYHLKLLKTAGLIKSKKDKNFLSYNHTKLGKKILNVIES